MTCSRSSTRTLLYAVRGSIPVRTFLGSKNRPCSIRMQTEQPKTGKHPDIKCGHGGRSVGRSDPYADICGHLLAKSIFANKTKAENFFVDHLLNHRVLRHHISILYCSPPPHIGALLKWGYYGREISPSLRTTKVLAIVLELSLTVRSSVRLLLLA